MPISGGAIGVRVIIAENRQGGLSSNSGGSCLHFILCKGPKERYESNNSPASYK